MYVIKIICNAYKNEFLEERKGLFQELPFYNTFIEKPRIKHLKNMDLLHELPLDNGLSIEKISKAFEHLKDMQEVIELKKIDSKDPLVQLKASKSSIRDLFQDLLIKIKGFKYQITVKGLLHKENGDIEFAPVYFNSATKTVILLKE